MIVAFTIEPRCSSSVACRRCTGALIDAGGLWLAWPKRASGVDDRPRRGDRARAGARRRAGRQQGLRDRRRRGPDCGSSTGSPTGRARARRRGRTRTGGPRRAAVPAARQVGVVAAVGDQHRGARRAHERCVPRAGRMRPREQRVGLTGARGVVAAPVAVPDPDRAAGLGRARRRRTASAPAPRRAARAVDPAQRLLVGARQVVLDGRLPRHLDDLARVVGEPRNRHQHDRRRPPATAGSRSRCQPRTASTANGKLSPWSACGANASLTK